MPIEWVCVRTRDDLCATHRDASSYLRAEPPVSRSAKADWSDFFVDRPAAQSEETAIFAKIRFSRRFAENKRDPDRRKEKSTKLNTLHKTRVTILRAAPYA